MPVTEETLMDPQAAWNEMLDSILGQDWDEVRDRADGLLNWIRTGGVPPQTAAVSMRRQWNRTMAEFGCLVALQLVEKSRQRKQRRG